MGVIVMNTEQLIHDLKQLGRYSDLEPNYWLLAVEKIEELSGKQIPKKPMGIYDENEYHIKDEEGLYESALFGICPSCNKEVQDGMIYCSFCGQALDWGDTE